MIPDLVIGGRAVSRAELDEAAPLDPTTYLCVAETGVRDLHAERDRYAATRIAEGCPPDRAVYEARRAAEAYDRRRSAR